MASRLLLAVGLGLAVPGTSAMELTPENWDQETSGKTVFVKFFAPWCGHCKKIKPDWDKLMKNWNKSKRAKTGLIADVDCIGAGKDLCDKHGVKSFPTLKWGDPNAMEDYTGERDYDGLKKFALDKLKPICSPANLDLCDELKKKEIADLQAMPSDELAAKIAEKQKTIKDAEESFETEVKALQEKYTQLQKTKDETVEAIKKSGLGLMLTVQAHAKKPKEGKGEL